MTADLHDRFLMVFENIMQPRRGRPARLPLRWPAWLHLFFKDHEKPIPGSFIPNEYQK
jgi:hypothetical protein